MGKKIRQVADATALRSGVWLRDGALAMRERRDSFVDSMPSTLATGGSCRKRLAMKTHLSSRLGSALTSCFNRLWRTSFVTRILAVSAVSMIVLAVGLFFVVRQSTERAIYTQVDQEVQHAQN